MRITLSISRKAARSILTARNSADVETGPDDQVEFLNKAHIQKIWLIVL